MERAVGDRLTTLRGLPDHYASALLSRTSCVDQGVWQEIARVLRPGAHVLVFGGYGVSLALRRSQFEIRDSVFVFSSSMQRNLVATLARKPVEESTVTAQILATGTGALNIDGTRIRHSSVADFEKHKAGVEAIKARGGQMGNSWKNSSDLSGANEVTTAGRWPANAIFAHTEACQRVGTKRVQAPVINRFGDGMKPFGGGAGHAYASIQTGDAEGMENVETWSCSSGCPVEGLDQQSRAARTAEGASRFFRTFGATLGADVPVDLLSYLVTLVCPKKGILLDPFSTGEISHAAEKVQREHFGIEGS